jgi:LmbE family N-acetylglucosaminyl deacetylase
VTVPFPLVDGDQPVTRILALGAHADDIEIGCGATLLALTRARSDVEVTWLVFGADGARAEEAAASAARFLENAGRAEVHVHGFRDGYFPYVGTELKDIFEALKAEVDPQLIFTHTRFDLHQDHRLVCELTWNTFRNHLILEYEVPKYDGDLGAPNVFVPVSRELAEEKVRILHEEFPTQSGKHWFDSDLFFGVMRLRGMEAHAASRYAEAFTCRKLSLGIG